ncbi:MAG: mannitol dehydrogenase family protein [Proteobacteria bacterium]|nr:mannitol dehydrogenase family protein [Pseudomonadota bacterium]
MAQRLTLANAGALLPYDRSRVTPGIVHLGIGAFFRSHAAVYLDSVLKEDPSWGVIGASLKRPDTRNALLPQDFLYTLAVRSAAGTDTRVIGSLLDVLDATAQRDALLDAMADPRVRIVSLTITEKGYCHDPATGKLDLNHPDIRHDLAHPESPVSAAGLIVRALELRRMRNVKPFTVLCCDNQPANGETVGRIVTAFARERDAALGDHVAREVSFPSTMVDRIVPATTDEDRALVREATGLDDAWPVMTEPFCQWVVEDRFPSGRPALEGLGVEMVEDVRPFEFMKLRMLNGSHSTLAYLGYLAGYEYVSQAMANADYRSLIHGLMTEEVMATLPMERHALTRYRDALLERFTNPALKHRTWQIAMDGSQKLPQRLLGTIRDRLARGLPVARLSLGVAAWMRYVTGEDESGNAIDVRDPLAERLKAIGAAARRNPVALVDGLLQVKEVFGEDLGRNAILRSHVSGHLASLFDHGAKQTVASLVGGLPKS